MSTVKQNEVYLSINQVIYHESSNLKLGKKLMKTEKKTQFNHRSHEVFSSHVYPHEMCNTYKSFEADALLTHREESIS